MIQEEDLSDLPLILQDIIKNKIKLIINIY